MGGQNTGLHTFTSLRLHKGYQSANQVFSEFRRSLPKPVDNRDDSTFAAEHQIALQMSRLASCQDFILVLWMIQVTPIEILGGALDARTQFRPYMACQFGVLLAESLILNFHPHVALDLERSSLHPEEHVSGWAQYFRESPRFRLCRNPVLRTQHFHQAHHFAAGLTAQTAIDCQHRIAR